MYGWHGRILFINLSNQSFHTEPIPDDRLQADIGGRGLAVRLFQDYALLDPFDPDMPLIFTAGPLSGTKTPATERLCILSRSPLTGTIFDTSSGGSFAHEFKASGYDGLIIKGKSTKPVAMRIHPSGVEFIDAEKLCGKTTSETISAFSQRGIAAIGPAGENRVLYANIVFSDGDNTGRGGLGAVMGSKKLKAIAVEGDRQTTIADPQKLQVAQQDILRLFRASPALLGQLGLHEYGTPTFVDLTNQRRMLPTKNFSETFFNPADKLSGPAIRKALDPEHDTCHDCPIACKKSNTDYGRLPEYSALCHFGALLGISDLHAVVVANKACRELGIDPVSAASTLATRAEITGEFPHGDELVEILRQTCLTGGSDLLLAQGSRRLAEALGQPDASMTVKSLELPAFDPRGATGMALSFCTSTLGGTQVRANMQSCEILRKPVAVNRFTFSGKARLIKNAEDTRAASDSMLVCQNAFYAASLEEYAVALSAVTGLDYSPAGLSQTGEQIVKAEIDINRGNGFSAKDDMLPERFFNQPGSASEGINTPPLNRTDFEEELQKYYRIRGLADNIPLGNATKGRQL